MSDPVQRAEHHNKVSSEYRITDIGIQKKTISIVNKNKNKKYL